MGKLDTSYAPSVLGFETLFNKYALALRSPRESSPNIIQKRLFI